MTVYAALLRGVNVGGVKLGMSDLRRVAAAAGCVEPRTFIQSGNLVFSTARRDAEKVGGELRSALKAELGLDIAVIMRTKAELAAAIDANPFLKAGGNPASQSVAFFADDVDPALLADIDLTKYEPEAARVHKREVYFNLPKGTGHSPMLKDIGRRKGLTIGTMRNWRTTLAVLAMMD